MDDFETFDELDRTCSVLVWGLVCGGFAFAGSVLAGLLWLGFLRGLGLGLLLGVLVPVVVFWVGDKLLSR